MHNPIHVFSITDNFPKFRVYPYTNVGAIQARVQATSYYDTNLTPHPRKVIPLTDFSENQSHPCIIPSMFSLLLTTSQSFVYIHIQM
jgi:hypothetical protein